MTKIVDTITEYEAKGLDALSDVQSQVLDQLERVVERLDERLPENRPELPAEVPTLKELVDTQFAFAKKVLANQERFAKDVVKALQPLTLPRETENPKVVEAA